MTETTVMPYSANCQLVMTLSGGAQAIGTDWLLGPKLVVTAGHCVHEGKDGDFFESIEVIPGMNGPMRPFGSQTVSKSTLRASNDWKTSGEVSLDYGVIILDAPFISLSGAKPGNYEIQVLSDTDLTGKTIFLSGYPADKAFGSQWKDSGPLNSVLASRLRYMLDTFGGQSGSAVIPIGETSAVGIHNYGGAPITAFASPPESKQILIPGCRNQIRSSRQSPPGSLHFRSPGMSRMVFSPDSL